MLMFSWTEGKFEASGKTKASLPLSGSTSDALFQVYFNKCSLCWLVTFAAINIAMYFMKCL